VIVPTRDQDLTVDQLRELARCIHLPEIIEIFGRIGAIKGEFGRFAEIALSPDVEGLPPDDERSVGERQCRRETMDDVSGKRFAAQR
jgi:hypothetical protein